MTPVNPNRGSRKWRAYVAAVMSKDEQTWQTALVMQAGFCGQIPCDAHGSYDDFLILNVHLQKHSSLQ